jgi:hypothetical protein
MTVMDDDCRGWMTVVIGWVSIESCTLHAAIESKTRSNKDSIMDGDVGLITIVVITITWHERLRSL